MTSKLGKTARDRVTGVTGTITARCEYLGESTRIRIENADKDGQPKEHWFAEERIGLKQADSGEAVASG